MGNPEYIIILNEHAGAGRAIKVWPTIEDKLNQAEVKYRLVKTKYQRHATEIAKKFAHQTPQNENDKSPSHILLVIGGDGTLHETVTGLQEVGRGDIPVAYIPSGSGNDFARGIKLSRDPLKALEQVLSTKEKRQIDIGVFDETIKHEKGIFINNLGIGFDAAIVSATNNSTTKIRLNKYHLGSLAYLFSLVKVFFEQNSFQATIYVDGQPQYFEHAFLLTTTNHPYFGGGVPIMPTANVLDGELDLVVVEKMNPFFFIILFVSMFFGKHLNFKAFNHYRAKHLRVRTNALEFGQIDGEEMGSRSFDITFKVGHQALWLNLPDLTSDTIHQK